MTHNNNSKSLFIKNALYIDPFTFAQTHTHIKVELGPQGKIHFIQDIPQEADEIIDAQGNIVTRSFVIGHHHIYSALATGMPAPKKNPTNFFEILKYIWWTLDKSLAPEMIQASALTTAIYAAKAGATFIIDHHASPFAIRGSLELIASALDKVGLGHLLCYEITDRDGQDRALEGLDETDDYLYRRQALVGLHASFTVSDQTMKKAALIMDKHSSGVHIHVAEDKVDEDLCTIDHGKRVIERLKDFGMLDSSRTILAHAIHINEHERKLLLNSRAWIVQNPESNLNNKVGFFSANGLDPHRIMLGTDGMHSDMMRSAHFAYYAGLAFEPQDLADIYNRLRNNHIYLKANGFVGDSDNNLIILDYQPRTPITQENFLGHFFYALSSYHIRHVISQGRIIVQDRKMTTIDEQEVFSFAQQQASILWEKMQKI